MYKYSYIIKIKYLTFKLKLDSIVNISIYLNISIQFIEQKNNIC